jgi:peptide deformylase
MKYQRSSLLLYSEDVDKILSTPCEKVTVFDNHLQEFVDYMFEMVEKHDGIGISANQLGVAKRLFVIKLGFYKEVFINSSFSFVDNKKNVISSTEGCLSFPNRFKTLKRFDEITAQFQNLKGKPKSLVLTDLASVAFQHEWHHGQGIHFESE